MSLSGANLEFVKHECRNGQVVVVDNNSSAQEADALAKRLRELGQKQQTYLASQMTTLPLHELVRLQTRLLYQHDKKVKRLSALEQGAQVFAQRSQEQQLANQCGQPDISDIC